MNITDLIRRLQDIQGADMPVRYVIVIKPHEDED